MIIKCEVCGHNRMNESEGEFVCENCGASFCLELIGYYEEGSNERIECGDEFYNWKKKWREKRKQSD